MLTGGHRTSNNMFQLCGRRLVRHRLRALPSVPVLPPQRKRRDEAGAGADGEEARDHRGEEGSAAESKGGDGEGGGGEEIGGAKEEELGVLGR